MKPLLLDVNVLVALAWEVSEHHVAAREWFAKQKMRGFATCPITQAGFVRLSSNAALFSAAATPRAALLVLERVTADPLHSFWPDDIAMREAMGRVGTIYGHRQVTDAYLIGLAEAHGGNLATFDGKIWQLAPDVVELIP